MRIEKYSRITFWPMAVLSIAFLYFYCVSNFHLAIAESHPTLFSVADNVIWAIFIIDYLILLGLSESKWLFFRTHIFHLVVVALPFLRVLRIGLLILMLTKTLGQLKNRILISIPVYTIVATGLFALLGAASVYDAEYQSDGSNIKTPQDAFWWAAVTIFTVGYGDKFPVTGQGRLYGVGLMICGIAIVGTVTATFAGWLIGQIREVESENIEILKKLEKIEARLIQPNNDR